MLRITTCALYAIKNIDVYNLLEGKLVTVDDLQRNYKRESHVCKDGYSTLHCMENA